MDYQRGRGMVAQLGRFLQPDPAPGGSANAYAYAFGDPVNTSDPSGEYTLGGPSQALINGTAQIASEATAEQAAINAAARAEAERKAEEAAAILAAAAGPQYEEEGEEWGEEEWAEEEGEYVSYHPSEGKQTTPVLEEGLLFHAKSEEDNGADKHAVAMCVEHSKAAGRPCIKYVGIFGEIWHAVKSGWHAIKSGGGAVVKTLHQVFLSVHAWYRANRAAIHHWECTIDGGVIGVATGVLAAPAGPWASGFIGAGAGIATTEACERA